MLDNLPLQKQIQENVKVALRAKDEVRLSVVRGLIAAFVNELVAKGRKPSDALSDEETLAVIRRSAKQRKDSIEQFNKGGRSDLADKESKELSLLEEYLPKLMERGDIEKIVRTKYGELTAKMGADKINAGVLMGAAMKDLAGKADGMEVKNVVSEILQNP
ncbi:GatB/YqeY domain-containing protein [bacterium]|nr:GatB/YqeY domain-containing protein [bacterium]